MVWKIRGRVLTLERTLIMGILNITPDSFSDGGDYPTPEKAAFRAVEMESQGADILDLGAESTRPGAEPISADAEIRRLLPVLDQVLSKVSIPVSIDTAKAEVAEACLKKGAAIINDVSGLEVSGRKMADLARETGAGLVLMHRRGNPKTMQSLAIYGDVVKEVVSELIRTAEQAKSWGVDPAQIVLDPGFGFAKTSEQNFEMLERFEEFCNLGYPVLAGVSRKSFLALSAEQIPKNRDSATAAASAAAVLKGAKIIRVHEISGLKEAVRTAEKIKNTARGEEQHVRA